MATTPSGLPYPVGTDPVRDGDNAIQALAEAIDPRLPFAIVTGQVQLAGAANEMRVASVTYPAGRFTALPEVMITSRTSTASAATTNTELWTQAPTLAGIQIGVNRNNTTSVVVAYIGMQRTYAGGPALLAARAAAPLGDDPATMVAPCMVTCHTELCENADVPLLLDLGWVDEEGGVHRVSNVSCGPCGQPITDVVDV